MKILIIDDEASIRNLLKVNFESNNFTVIEADTAERGTTLAASHHPHLIILDMGLPDGSGMMVLKAVRAWSQIPIIVLTVQDGDQEKVSALDAGADDYMTKPFSVPELMARVRVAIRHVQLVEPGVTVIKNGPLEIDRSARTAKVDGVQIKLTATEYEILQILIESRGKVVTHRTILNAVWGPNAVEHSHYLRVYLGQIRKKLKTTPNANEIIETESGVGYRMKNFD